MGILTRALLLGCLLLVSLSGLAEIYTWTDDNGRKHFTDKPPAGGDRQVEAVELGPLNTYNAPSKVFIDETLARPVTRPNRRAGVIMYSTTWCGVCVKAKNWLRANNIRFTDYDVEKSRRGQRDFKKLGGRGVPVILVGKQRMNGFSPSRMQQMLRNAGYRL